MSVAESCLTANPRSAMQHVPFFFTNIFFDFKSLWAIAGLPVRREKIKIKHLLKELIVIILSLYLLHTHTTCHKKVSNTSGNRSIVLSQIKVKNILQAPLLNAF